METMFRIGDRVVSQAFGMGVVRSIDSAGYYPVTVKFPTRTDIFTLEGKDRYYKTNARRDLTLLREKEEQTVLNILAGESHEQ